MCQHFHKIYILYDLLLVSEYPSVLAYVADPYCRRLLRNICIPHLVRQPVLYIADLLNRLLLHCLEESILSGTINTLTKSSTLKSSTIGLCASTAIDSFQRVFVYTILTTRLGSIHVMIFRLHIGIISPGQYYQCHLLDKLTRMRTWVSWSECLQLNYHAFISLFTSTHISIGILICVKGAESEYQFKFYIGTYWQDMLHLPNVWFQIFSLFYFETTIGFHFERVQIQICICQQTLEM